MSQTTFDDEELFGEAAEEVRADVETALGEARSALPDPDDVWDADADNVLGVLNGLRSAMDAGDAEAHLRDAKKWYTMGERADAFEDADELAAEIEAVEDVVAEMAEAREQVSDLAGTVPELRSALTEAHEAAGGAGDDGSETDGGEPDEETAAGGEEGSGGDEEAAADGGEPADGEQATLDGDDD